MQRICITLLALAPFSYIGGTNTNKQCAIQAQLNALKNLEDRYERVNTQPSQDETGEYALESYKQQNQGKRKHLEQINIDNPEHAQKQCACLDNEDALQFFGTAIPNQWKLSTADCVRQESDAHEMRKARYLAYWWSQLSQQNERTISKDLRTKKNEALQQCSDVVKTAKDAGDQHHIDALTFLHIIDKILNKNS